MPESPPRTPLPDPKPPAGVPRVKRSVHVETASGHTVSFSGLQDYLDYHVAQGAIRDLNDLLTRHLHLVGEIFFNWIRGGQLACLFAVQLSKSPRENGWASIVKTGALSIADLPTVINSELDAFSMNHHEGAALILPDITTPEQIVELVNKLCSDPAGRWYRTAGTAANAALEGINLRWILPGGGSVNYVLGFADLPSMPITRRAPFTALFFRVSDFKRTEVETENGLVRVHLADLDSQLGVVHAQVQELTEKKRKEFVEQSFLAVAKAKVTFSIPAELASALCAPRPIVEAKSPAIVYDVTS